MTVSSERESVRLQPVTDPRFTPTEVRAPLGAPWFEVAWADTATLRLPNPILRGYCPCAGCQGHSGRTGFLAGHDSELREIATVGNYALRLVWGDGHGSGIYTFQFLRQLGELYALHGAALPELVPELPRR
jgi:DUF971 family protein